MAAKRETFLQRFIPSYFVRNKSAVRTESREDFIVRAAAEGTGRYTVIGGWTYNGEKNLGQLGPVKGYSVDYATLRQRSWDMLLDSGLAQTVIKKYVAWVIGKGLKAQSEPEMLILKQEGINFDKEEWTRLVEARFNLYKKSKAADHSGMDTLNRIEAEAFKAAKVGGDVLVILRYENNYVTVQLIDGTHVVSPIYGSESFAKVLDSGNRIVEGVELNKKGQHVAYHVRKPNTQGYQFETERVQARSKSGRMMAYMVYGWKYRIDSVRGMPLLSVMMETAKQLDEYQNATLGSAEERQKIAYFIEHQPSPHSTGDNPLAGQTVRMRDVNKTVSPDLGTDSFGAELADKIAATTKKMTYNLPLGAAMKELTSKNELYFKDFFAVNIDVFCAAAEIPPNVAMSKYDSNFSASRAALKEWDNTLNVQREDFSSQFLQPVYDFVFETDVYKGKIQAPGYLSALKGKNVMVLMAYQRTRFIGVPVPHIDPVKEVEAERAKLGEAAAAIPLTTVEQATEVLNGGDSESNIEQFAKELGKSKKLGIKVEEPPVVKPGAAKPAAKKKD